MLSSFAKFISSIISQTIKMIELYCRQVQRVKTSRLNKIPMFVFDTYLLSLQILILRSVSVTTSQSVELRYINLMRILVSLPHALPVFKFLISKRMQLTFNAKLYDTNRQRIHLLLDLVYQY